MNGGKDYASSRYIFTNLNELTRLVYPEDDMQVMDYQNDEGMTIEPTSYVPILPMVLVNGAEGIGSGWATSIPQYNPIHIVANLKLLMRG